MRFISIVTILLVWVGLWVDVAQAAKATARRVAKAAQEANKRRAAAPESNLAPKVDRQVDSDLSKVKNFTPTELQQKGPGLSSNALDQTNVDSFLDDKLDEEIRLSTDLLQFETACEEIAPIKYRLADLYWERAKRYSFRAESFEATEAERKAAAADRDRTQLEVLSYYQSILDECSQYSDLAKILFYYGRALVEMDQAVDATKHFDRIIKDFPSSEWVAQSWFMLGEYQFNKKPQGDPIVALRNYNKAAEYKTNSIYPYAIYKQGWCFINVGEFKEAQERFELTIRLSERTDLGLEEKTRMALRKEALKDYVRVYANIGDANKALSQFKTLTKGMEWAWMLESLGNWYIGQGAHVKVITVLKDLIKGYQRSTRLPVYQGRVVDAQSKLGVPKDTVREVKVLTDYFDVLRKRIKQKDIPKEDQPNLDKDIREAEEIAENTVRRLATDFHKEAKKLHGLAQERELKFALDLYRHYLEVFPEPKAGSDVNYVFFMRFYYAEVLYRLESFELAAENYDRVVAMNPKPTDPKEKTIVLAAAEEAVRSYDELVQDLDRKDPPEISGREEKPIPTIKQRLIDACKRYIEYVGMEGERIVEIRYKMARIYYVYNHFSKAAPAFQDIVQNHPESKVACYAANLALDIYNGEQNYAKMKEFSHIFLANKTLACGEEDRKRFLKIEEQSSFFLVKSDLEDNKKYLAAGNAYMQFYKDYPQSEYADKAVYNSAVNYDLGNRWDKANEVRQFLVEKLPNSPLVPETLYNIALSHERIVNFQEAAHYLEEFAKRYPNDKRSKDAIYDSAIYRLTLRDYTGGRTGQANYIKLYPKADDVAKVALASCESFEEEGRDLEKIAKKQRKPADDARLAKVWNDAQDCYGNYVKSKQYGASSNDSICYAQFRRAELMRFKLHQEKAAEDQVRFIQKMWPTWKKAGNEKIPRCVESIAELEFRELQAPTKKVFEMTISELNPISPKAKKAFDQSLKMKLKARDEQIEQYKKVASLGVAKWSLASLYQIGDLYMDSINKLLEAPIVDKIAGEKITAEDKQLLRDSLRAEAKPIEEQAIEAYQFCVEQANALGFYNKWSVKALDMLQQLRPEIYPQVNEYRAKVALEEPLRLSRNGFVILDGKQYKPFTVALRTQEMAATTGNKSPEPNASHSNDPGKVKQSHEQGVPTPVEEN